MPESGVKAPAPTAGPREERLTELGQAFRRAYRSLRRLRGRDTHRGDELGHAQFELLGELYARGPMHAGELAEAVAASADVHSTAELAGAFGTAYWWALGICAASIIPVLVLLRAEGPRHTPTGAEAIAEAELEPLGA